MAMEWAVKAEPFTEYDGTNALEIAEAVADFTTANSGSTVWTGSVVSEGGGTAVILISTTDEGFGDDERTLTQGNRLGLLSGWDVTPSDWDDKFVKVS
jgi:hypothetical protein